MKFSERVKVLGLPADQFVVIGSGLLDELGLRMSNDIDLVVSDKLFDQLAQTPGFVLRERYGHEVLEYDEVDAGKDWSGTSFEVLMKGSQVINGVHFVGTDFLLDWKRTMARDKDISDVKLLENHYAKQ